MPIIERTDFHPFLPPVRLTGTLRVIYIYIFKILSNFQDNSSGQANNSLDPPSGSASAGAASSGLDFGAASAAASAAVFGASGGSSRYDFT